MRGTEDFSERLYLAAEQIALFCPLAARFSSVTFVVFGVLGQVAPLAHMPQVLVPAVFWFVVQVSDSQNHL
ncbi:hypothetical protein J7444_19695 [Labrenzia sp. R4_1]|uniref:hypothetical protein n=1 Tax=Labrenzia sp. R4_1 TaxID=2821106 RepID=UPI001ADD2339|nr:hypothetical protein [Labrenzia sp. R4_1]MBO9426968.1 hypothetical protein [Labrenzia sp. R4_1]